MPSICRKILDEALTAEETRSSLSKPAENHISNCTYCKNTLSTISILTSAKSSILLQENNTALKARILAKLQPIVSAKAVATKTAKASLSTITKIFVGSAVAVTVFACAYTLSSSSTSKETNNSITNQAISLHCEEKAKQQSQPKATPVNGKDLKNLNTELSETKSVPSSIKDN